MSEFAGSKNIFEQSNYENRVKIEAEMMVALEGLKEAVTYLSFDVQEVQARIDISKDMIGLNHEKVYDNFKNLEGDYGQALSRSHQL